MIDFSTVTNHREIHRGRGILAGPRVVRRASYFGEGPFEFAVVCVRKDRRVVIWSINIDTGTVQPYPQTEGLHWLHYYDAAVAMTVAEMGVHAVPILAERKAA